MSGPASGPSRRRALAGLLMLSAGTTARGTAADGSGRAQAASDADAALRLASGAFWTCQRELDALECLPSPPFGTSAAKALEKRYEALLDRRDSVMHAMADCVAETCHGFALKGAIVAAELPDASDVLELNSDSAVMRLAVSLARDVVAAR
ncbi:hypothetical protein [Brytella acorum]|uniref:Uncharacterized protein n=1 Tax=Brytella acorum TaxID=2959299 RepID=A0AA35UXA0_9PROT|nr:hypothetical protein [Brytella acorum]MDF3625709.1 hypothetical protein [Brytella acorum]CAI9121338.1 hypothetical protein LMG32879_002185 [Brytella acorum]